MDSANEKLERKTAEIYQILYNDPLNQIQQFYPPWERLGKIGRQWWMELIRQAQIDN